jgi:hypothetical protein
MPRISIPTKGLSSLAQAIMSGQDAAAQGFDEGMGAQAKTALAMQQIKSQQAAERAHDAEASLKGYQAQGEKASLDANTPEALRNTAMIEQGIPLDDANAVDAYLKTGRLGGRYGVTGDDGMGPVLPLPDWAVTAKSKPIASDQFTDRQLDTGPTSKLGSLARTLATMQQAIARGDGSVKNLAEANSIKRTGSLSDAIIRGGLDRNAVAGAQAAIEGKPMYSSHEYGSSDNFTGAVDSSGPVAQTFKTYRDSETTKNKEQAGAAKANAAESYAGVGLKKAQAAKTQQEIAQGKAGSIQQTDNGMVIVDTRTGTARPVMGLDGKPLQGKTKPLTEGEANALNYASRMQEANEIFDDLAKREVDRPGWWKRTAEATAGVIPFVGDKLVDPVGSMLNFTQSEDQQRIEQAQRNFINAVLRRESGAAIGAGEFANAQKQYFPAAGDEKFTIEQKRQNRIRATQGILAAVPQNMRNQIPPKSGGASGEFDPASDVRSQADAILKGGK